MSREPKYTMRDSQPIPAVPDVPEVGILCGVPPLEVRQPVPSGYATGWVDEEGAMPFTSTSSGPLPRPCGRWCG